MPETLLLRVTVARPRDDMAGADPAGDHASIFRTEARATATDATARAKFRRCWSVFSPGIRSIRRLTLAPLKSEAERRAMR